MSETAARHDEDNQAVERIDRIGNAIVGSALVVLGACVVAHTFGVAFIGFIAAGALLVLGLMMNRGMFGDNATMGTLMATLGPAAVLVPPFFPALFIATPIIGAFFLVAGVAKLVGLW
ncbi:MAG: hypothetical protein ACPHID_04470 [Thermoplasmatota archaeon]